MWFCVWTTKRQQRKLGCIKDNFHIFLRSIRIILNRITPVGPLLLLARFYILSDQLLHFYVMHWTDVFEIIALN